MNEPIIVPDLVSTIIPAYNRPALVREAVQSVLEQTHRPIEIIIVDDESTDDTPARIRELVYAYPEIIRTVRQENGGPGVARETGRKLAHGEFIQYLDSDDLLLPRKFEKQVAMFHRHPDTGVAYCKTYEVEIGAELAGAPSARTGERFTNLFPHLLTGRIWQTATPLFRRSLSDRVGPWTNQRQEEDWEYDSRIAALRTQLVWNDEFLCVHRHHGGERAGGNSLGDPVKMRWRANTQRLLFERATETGIDCKCPEMQQFSRSLFLLARQCGAAGLGGESRRLFELSRTASGPERALARDFQVYRLLTTFFGWRLVGRICCRLDCLLNYGD